MNQKGMWACFIMIVGGFLTLALLVVLPYYVMFSWFWWAAGLSLAAMVGGVIGLIRSASY